MPRVYLVAALILTVVASAACSPFYVAGVTLALWRLLT